MYRKDKNENVDACYDYTNTSVLCDLTYHNKFKIFNKFFFKMLLKYLLSCLVMNIKSKMKGKAKLLSLS